MWRWQHLTWLALQVLAQQGRARASRLTLPHGVCHTPMFMPVGTQGDFCGRLQLLLHAQEPDHSPDQERERAGARQNFATYT